MTFSWLVHLTMVSVGVGNPVALLGLSTLIFDNTVIFKNILSWLDPDTPGTHREVARRCVGERQEVKYIVYHPEERTRLHAAIEINLFRAHRRLWNPVAPAFRPRCDLCLGPDFAIVQARVGVVNPCLFANFKWIPNTEAARDYINHNMVVEDMRLCLGCRVCTFSEYT